MLIRKETPEDFSAIRQLNQATFGGDYEADLVDQLRADELIALSLVAWDGDELVGHICFSRLPTQVDGRRVRAVSLAPMAVKPDHQRRGIGSQLIAEGLAALPALGIEAVLVLGHPNYYPRFGFSPEPAQKLASPFRGKKEFMALELVPGALLGEKGSVTYPKAFGIEAG